ncbi:MAG: DUF4364 family protein [Ruminococcaceae bacterium]|nr:DUF4364 family protein [Oscillospiraceae bacterium]
MADFTIAEAKIRILYLVSRVPGISYHLLMNRCLDQLYADFFTFSRAYEELIAGNLMDRSFEDADSNAAVGGTETLTISAGGKALLDDAMPAINSTVIANLESSAKELAEEMRLAALVTSSKTPVPGGLWKVSLFSDNKGMPFRCELTVNSEDEASELCRAWKASHGTIPAKLSDLIRKKS